MSNVNNVHIEGIIIDCIVEKTPNNSPYANIVVCTPKSKDADSEKSFHYARFPVTETVAENVRHIEATCKHNKQALAGNGTQLPARLVSLDGELYADHKGQSIIFVTDNSISFPEKISRNNNTISLQGVIVKVMNTSPLASALLVQIHTPKGRNKTTVPVIVDAGRNPKEWANIASGAIGTGDSISLSGKLDGKLFGNLNDVMLRTSVLSKSITLRQNIKKTASQKFNKAL